MPWGALRLRHNSEMNSMYKHSFKNPQEDILKKKHRI